MEGSHGRGQTPHKVGCILERHFLSFSNFSRVEILESQLTTYGKAMTEDKLREETKRLMSDKESYQTAAKENLKRLVDEKLEASKRLKEVNLAGCFFLMKDDGRRLKPCMGTPQQVNLKNLIAIMAAD